MLRIKGGYSFVEILVALALIGVGLIAVAGIYPFGLAHIRIMGERVFAVQQAQTFMEIYKAESYSTLFDLRYFNFPRESVYDTEGNRTKFEYRVYIKDPPGGVDENLVLVQVELYWNESNPFGQQGIESKTFLLESYKRQQSN